MSRRKRSTWLLSNKPVGTSPPKRPIRSDQRISSGSTNNVRHQSIVKRGRLAARCRYSHSAGRMKVSGRKRASSLSPVMKMRHISAVPMRFARPAARKAPLLTPM